MIASAKYGAVTSATRAGFSATIDTGMTARPDRLAIYSYAHLPQLFKAQQRLEEAPDDAAGIAKALGDIARAKGMSQVAKDAGLSRESLYRALSADGNPSFATVLKVARALGVKLHAEAA
mgnify:CR=1 FL=1